MSGVCFTVVASGAGDPLVRPLAGDARPLDPGRLAPGDPVNLERPVTLSARLGGHLVQGHVDGVGEVAGDDRTTPAAPCSPFAYRRGCFATSWIRVISVDGVSLTVAAIAGDGVQVALIPTRWR